MGILDKLWKREAMVSNVKLMRSHSKRRRRPMQKKSIFEHIEEIERAEKVKSRRYQKEKYYIYVCRKCGDSRYFKQARCGNCGGKEFDKE